MPASIMKMQISGPCIGASIDLGKLIMVDCPEFYRRNKEMIDSPRSGWLRGEGLTTDYLDCALFSEWWWKFRTHAKAKEAAVNVQM